MILSRLAVTCLLLVTWHSFTSVPGRLLGTGLWQRDWTYFLLKEG